MSAHKHIGMKTPLVLHVVGGWYVQPDCNLASPSTYALHARVAGEWFRRRLGAKARTGYNVDSFGHAATLPDFYAGAGIENYLFIPRIVFPAHIAAGRRLVLRIVDGAASRRAEPGAAMPPLSRLPCKFSFAVLNDTSDTWSLFRAAFRPSPISANTFTTLRYWKTSAKPPSGANATAKRTPCASRKPRAECPSDIPQCGASSSAVTAWLRGAHSRNDARRNTGQEC